MWTAHGEPVPSGQRFSVLQDDTPVSFREFFFLLESNEDFADWYSRILLGCDYEAFFWELPPLTTSTIDKNAEFVLIESASLAGLRADATPFKAQFARQPDLDVITFPNLGKDALLIVPAPRSRNDIYPHFAAFLRSAPKDQTRLLWKLTAEAVIANLGDVPRWLSTAGLGVSWLHLRLDTRPKYYKHAPYKTPP